MDHPRPWNSNYTSLASYVLDSPSELMYPWHVHYAGRCPEDFSKVAAPDATQYGLEYIRKACVANNRVVHRRARSQSAFPLDSFCLYLSTAPHSTCPKGRSSLLPSSKLHTPRDRDRDTHMHTHTYTTKKQNFKGWLYGLLTLISSFVYL